MNNVIIAKDINSCFSYSDGEKIKSLIVDKINKDERVILDFKDILGLPTSFINGCFVELVKEVGLQKMKGYVTLKNVSKITSLTIKRMVNEVQ